MTHRPLPTRTFRLSDNFFYCKVENDLTPSNQKIVKETVHDLTSKQELPTAAQNLIITTPRTSVVYIKPKIHNPNNPGRLIVSAYSCPTELTSLTESLWAVKWDLVMLTFLSASSNNNFDKFDGTKPKLYRRYIDDCFGATSCSRQELDYFITSVNSFHPALKYTWVVSECSIALLDISVSISGNRLSTSVHYKPTDSHSYLLHSSSHPAHVKNSIPYSQFLRRRRLCSDDTDFSEKAEEMCQFFKTRGYPDIQLSTTANTVHSQSIRNRHHLRHTTN